MSEWHEHEAKAECLDLRKKVVEMERRIEELEGDTARVDALELLIRCRLWHDRVSWLFRPDDRSPPGSIVGNTFRKVIDIHIADIASQPNEGETTTTKGERK